MATQSPPTLDNLFDSFIENVQLVIDKLKDEDSTREPSPDFTLESYWSRLDIALKAMSAETSKLALWFSKPPLPKVSECLSLLDSVQRVSLAIVSAYYGLPKEQGLCLRKCVRTIVVDVMSGVQTLAKIIKQENYQCSPGLLQSTGTVWEACESFANLPRNNSQAVWKNIRSTSELVKDALEELEEARETEGGGGSGWDDLDQVLNRVDLDNDSNLGSWSDRDLAVLPPVIGLIKATRSCLKKISSAVKTNGQWGDEHSIAQLDDVADIVGQISPQVDEVVSCVYPPMQHGVVRTNANHLSGVLLQLLSRAKSSHLCKPEDSQWLTFLDHAINHNLEQITNLTVVTENT